MDFLMNAAKIAQEVQGKKKKQEGEGSGGFGDLIGGFMGGGEKHKPQPRHDEEVYGSKPKPRRDEDEYGDERPHKTEFTGAEHKKKTSTSELFASAQVSSSLRNQIKSPFGFQVLCYKKSSVFQA